MPKMTRISRDIPNLVTALRRHLTLLREYSDRAFRDCDESFYGEVAGKLRVLTYKSHTNKPLLLSLMEEMNVDIPITLNTPPGDITMSLPEYMNSLAFAARMPPRGLVEVSHNDLVAMWAQQYGASHEDWEISEELAFILNSGVFIRDTPSGVVILRLISNTVLWVGNEFLERIDSEELDPEEQAEVKESSE
jgi:hypothetical protein